MVLGEETLSYSRAQAGCSRNCGFSMAQRTVGDRLLPPISQMEKPRTEPCGNWWQRWARCAGLLPVGTTLWSCCGSGWHGRELTGGMSLVVKCTGEGVASHRSWAIPRGLGECIQ